MKWMENFCDKSQEKYALKIESDVLWMKNSEKEI